VTERAAAARSGDPAGRRGDAALMSIGEVLGHLRADFPDTTISKLRFLETEGLVEPRRTASGYRKYSWDDIARLRFVLTAQRDRYLPLRVIREQLAAWDSAAGGAAPARPALVDVSADRTQERGGDRGEPGEIRLTRAELLERSGLEEEALAELEAHGMLAPRAGGRYDGDALVVAAAAAGLAAYGLQVRHLRPYRAAADREVGLFAQLVAPLAKQNDPAARARAAEAARELTGLAQQLQAALVRAGLRDVLGR
jgi:DNA-binding transcriptional MerR regulator